VTIRLVTFVARIHIPDRGFVRYLAGTRTAET